MILIAEIRYRDAHGRYLPDGHGWWLRDDNGRMTPGWEEGMYLCLDFHNPDFRSHVAKQSKAAVTDRLALIKQVREAVGEEAIIIANANDRTTPQTAPYINGYFMECHRSTTAGDWRRISDTLRWAERHLRPPRVNCVETWYHNSREDLHLMRATTTLTLTQSDGYCLFSDPNLLPTGDHRHNWYPFWDKSLGRPIGKGQERPDGAWWREFDNGSVVYNPMGNKQVTITFPVPRTSVATGQTASKHQLNCPDGDIYLRPE